jgi:hypothetical protein
MTPEVGPCGSGPQPQHSGLRRQRAKQPFGCPLHIVESLTDIGRNSIVHHLGDLSGQNQTTGSQAGEMLGQRRLAQRDSLVEFPNRQRTVQQVAQDHQPLLVAERLQELRGVRGVRLHDVRSERGRGRWVETAGGGGYGDAAKRAPAARAADVADGKVIA